MNNRSVALLWLGALAVVLMGCYPPWLVYEAARPGQHLLLHAGVKTEKEAEQLARGTSGDNYVNRGGRKMPLKRFTGDAIEGGAKLPTA